MASSMDSAYTSNAVVNPLINSMAQLNRACAKKFKKLQKALQSPPYATPTPEDSTGAATVHWPSATWRTETISSFAKPSRRDPSQYIRLIGQGPTRQWPTGDHVCGPGCPVRPIRSARQRHQIQPLAPAKNRSGGQVVGLSWCVHVGPLTSVRGTHAAGELEFKAGVSVGVAVWHSPTARSLHQGLV